MNQRQQFLEAIYSDPQNDTRKLVFADWLEEQGDPRTELIRNDRLFILEDTRTVRDFFTKLTPDFKDDLEVLGIDPKITNWATPLASRGFVDGLKLTGLQLERHAKEIEALQFLTWLWVTATQFSQLNNINLNNLQSLWITNSVVPYESPWPTTINPPALRELRLGRITNNCPILLYPRNDQLDQPYLQQLERLSLANTNIDLYNISSLTFTPEITELAGRLVYSVNIPTMKSIGKISLASTKLAFLDFRHNKILTKMEKKALIKNLAWLKLPGPRTEEEKTTSYQLMELEKKNFFI
jgi:uncharacterized protein (TIGR02996 family)